VTPHFAHWFAEQAEVKSMAIKDKRVSAMRVDLSVFIVFGDGLERMFANLRNGLYLSRL
jgi:hypothetical protein